MWAVSAFDGGVEGLAAGVDVQAVKVGEVPKVAIVIAAWGGGLRQRAGFRELAAVKLRK